MIIKCKICGDEFLADDNRFNICSVACKERNRIDRINKNWLKREIHPRDCRLNDRVEQSKLYKNDRGILKKFNAVRG